MPHCFLICQVIAVLVDKGHLDGRADLDRARIGLLLARDHAKQRGFSCAVGADDAHNGASWHLETQVVDQHAVAKGLGDVDKLDHLMAQPFSHRDKNLVGLVALLVFKIRQLLKTGQTRLALGLARLGVLA